MVQTRDRIVPASVWRLRSRTPPSISASHANATPSGSDAGALARELPTGRESLEVGVVAIGADVGVVGDEGGAVEHGHEPADEHVLDAVPFEDGEQPLRIQRFRHGGCARACARR